MIQFNFPTVLLYGEKSVKKLPPEIKKNNLNRLLLVTDPGLVKIGLADQIIEGFKSSGLNINIFDGVHPNPLEEDVIQGVKAYQSSDYEGIIALGGGSAMDVAKTIRFMAVH